MKTQDQKLQHVKEAAGECYHDVQERVGETMGHFYFECSKCDTNDRMGNDYPSNPSPDDLNELFRLGRKLNIIRGRIQFMELRGEFSCYLGHLYGAEFKGSSDAEALLNALFIATGGKE